MNKVKTVVVLLALSMVSTSARAASMTPVQEWACHWDGGLSWQQMEEVLGVSGWYLGPDKDRPDDTLVFYPFHGDSGLLVRYSSGVAGRLSSTGFNTVGFNVPDWFSEECQAISEAHRPWTEPSAQ